APGIALESDELLTGRPHDGFDGGVHSEPVTDGAQSPPEGPCAEFQPASGDIGGHTSGDLSEELEFVLVQERVGGSPAEGGRFLAGSRGEGRIATPWGGIASGDGGQGRL